MSKTVLETERLILCQLSTDDAPFILELLNDESYIRFIGDKGLKTLDDATGIRRRVLLSFEEAEREQGCKIVNAKLRGTRNDKEEQAQ